MRSGRATSVALVCIRPLQRTLFAALGCLLVAGSCAVDDVAPTVTPAGCSDGPEACESTPSLDEIRGLAKSLGSEEFSQAMADLYGPLAALGGGCENFSGWADDVSVVTTLLDDASGLVEQVDSADTARMSDADRLARWVEQALLLDVVCDDVNAEADKTLVSSAGAVGAADRFRFALTGYQNTALGSRFWSFYEQPGHVAEALRLVDDYGNVDIVLTGDSSVKWAFDPLALSESTREIAVNFSADGLPATLYGRWLDDLEGLGVLPRAVVVGVSSWGTLISCSDQRIEAYDAASVARSASFEFVEALADTNPMLRASGGRTRQYASP
ncbi:MAG: hypothetical protein IH940_04680, partial [Acidobacteria bacterium]|nr:hypothetical protein [Acidobacteriota bacterium]